MQYAENTEKTNQAERRTENGTDIYQSGRLPSAESDRTGGTGSEVWEVRPASPVILEGTQKSAVHESVDFGQVDRAPDGDRGSGAEPHGTDFHGDDENRGRDGGTESQRPDGMGAEDELYSGFGGGDHSQGTHLQLTLLPTVEEQQNTIEQAEAEKAPAFVVSQEDIDAVLQKGSDYENGKYRIYEQFQKGLSQSENARFLKEEYGIGSFTDVNGLLSLIHI